jgi:transcriptional regulator with PAS, ATPase and Fis domain
LSERIGDVDLLAKHFLGMYSRQHERQIAGITDEALEQLERYNWPGNVRQLENVIERAVLLSKGNYIDLTDLPDPVRNYAGTESVTYRPMSLKQALAEPEKNIIRQALQTNQWNRQQTAKALQINRTTLFKKMKQYGLYDEAERLGLF